MSHGESSGAGAEEHVCYGLGKDRVLKGRAPNDTRAKEASKEVAHLERVYSWFPLGDHVKKHPVRCASHVPEPDPAGKQHNPLLSGHESVLVSWVGALAVFYVEGPS